MRKLVLLAGLVMVLVACSSPDPAPSTTRGSTAADSPGSTAPGSTVVAPTALDERLAWLVDLLDGAELTEADYQSAFTGDFIANVSFSEFADLIGQVGATGSNWSVGEFEEREDLAAVVILSSDAADAASVRADIALEPTTPFRIQGLRLQPATPPSLDNPPADFAAAAERLDEAGTARLLVAEVTSGECEAVFEQGAAEVAPVGSAIKLYVLGAVADAVAAEELDWSDDVTISEDLKSVPTGVMQDEDAGATFSLREMAEVMIALSDNTATDHLIDLIGRPAVEAALGDYGMTEPALNIPFMNTMDLMALKVGPASGLATQWLEADEEGRRALLDQVSDITPADIPLSEFVDPVMPDQIEWFASPEDMCRVLVHLLAVGDPLDKILSINPGLPADEGAFEVLAFKGGSEPGLVAMNWLVERPDGRRFVVAGSVVNTEEAMDQLEVTLLFGAVRDLVAGVE